MSARLQRMVSRVRCRSSSLYWQCQEPHGSCLSTGRVAGANVITTPKTAQALFGASSTFFHEPPKRVCCRRVRAGKRRDKWAIAGKREERGRVTMRLTAQGVDSRVWGSDVNLSRTSLRAT